MPSDIEIAQRARPKQIGGIAKSAGIKLDELIPYGNHIAKVKLSLLKRVNHKPDGKLILVTSVTPTKYGEGKTSTAIGLTQAFYKLKKKIFLCLREPSLGPMFGVKGGACGGGRSQVIPMEDINLHFTGDGYAVSAANNLLSAMLDNSIYFKNPLNINPKSIILRRTIDISDRTLRRINFDINNKISYKSGFDIIAASETMAILALSKDVSDLKKRIGRIIVAFSKNKKPISAEDLGAVGAMSSLLTNAIMPNLVQTIEGAPVFVHCGPFANIAHGANSIVSTKMALKLADYVITESGFGADLGAEKFFDIVCKQGNIKADLVVLVVSTRAVKANGLSNLGKHIDIIRNFGLEPIVAINKFSTDSIKVIDRIEKYCSLHNAHSYVSDAVSKGGVGAIDLAEGCMRALKSTDTDFRSIYDDNLSIKEKIEAIATKIYGAKSVIYSNDAKNDLKLIDRLRLNHLGVNIAKTQFSFSDTHKLRNMPKNWKLKIKAIRIFAGAGFVVPVAGDILLLPGLPKKPAAYNIDTDSEGRIKGLF